MNSKKQIEEYNSNRRTKEKRTAEPQNKEFRILKWGNESFWF